MEQKKYHLYIFGTLAFIAMMASVLYFVGFDIFAQNSTTPPYIPCTSVQCVTWGSCQTTGTQTCQEVEKIPAGCYLSSGTPNMTRTCTLPTCQYTCLDWDPCRSDGTQECVSAKKVDPNCMGGNPPAPRVCTMPRCGYNYTPWGPCTPNNYQTRQVTDQTPQPCVVDSSYPPITQQPCTYSPPTSGTSGSGGTTYPDCNYNYSDWGACMSSNIQTRAYSITNQPCTPISSPVTQQGCTYTAPSSTTPPTSNNNSTTLNCTPACSGWGACQPGGYMKRNCTAPTGCPSSGTWVEQYNCTYSSATTSGSGGGTTSGSTTAPAPITSCTIQCSAWSDCNSSGYQTQSCQKPYGTACMAYDERRPCIPDTSGSDSTAPTNCHKECSLNWGVCTPNKLQFKQCWPSPATCPGELSTISQSCQPQTCDYKYDNWSACEGGWQFRSITSVSPQGCVLGDPLLKQECTETATDSSGGNIQDATTESTEAQATAPVDPDFNVDDGWQRENFGTDACPGKICGGLADPDGDSLSNNDELRYGTKPLNRDSDGDGKTDGEEIAAGTDPLKSSAEGEKDDMSFENPRETGTAKPDIYTVTNIEMIDAPQGGVKYLKVTGKGPANSYITVYIYSGDPIVVTVKTDSNGDWTYTVDRELEDGDHEVYVAVTNNTGAIKAKSEPLPFVKTAQAVSVTRAAAPVESDEAADGRISFTKILFILALGFFLVIVAFILLGVVVKKIISKIKLV